MGCPVPQYGHFESFRVLDHCFMGCPVPQCGCFESFRVSRGAQSRNFGCANNKYIVCHAMVVCCCVSRGIHFLKAPLAPRWSQAPCHSVTSYAPACAPQVIVYFRCLLESLLDFRSGACRFCATEAATGVFPLFACLPSCIA